MKRLWLDLETTGVDQKKNAIIQMAGLIEVNDEIRDSFEYLIRPHEGAVIEAEALQVNKRSFEEIQGFDDPRQVAKELVGGWSQYINKRDRTDKFVIAGYRIDFDYGFMREFFYRHVDKFGLGSWAISATLDVSSYVADYVYRTGTMLKNYKLSTVCEFFGIGFGANGAHDALEDIKATRKLYKILTGQR